MLFLLEYLAFVEIASGNVGKTVLKNVLYATNHALGPCMLCAPLLFFLHDTA